MSGARRRRTEAECQVAYELSRSDLERILEGQLRILRVPKPVTEHRFHPVRGWRFDFAWPAELLAVEVEGITAQGGRHQTASGFRKDCEKYNAAALLGWRLLRYVDQQIRSWAAAREIAAALGVRVP